MANILGANSREYDPENLSIIFSYRKTSSLTANDHKLPLLPSKFWVRMWCSVRFLSLGRNFAYIA